MTAARALEPSSPGPAGGPGPERTRAPTSTRVPGATGDSRTLEFAAAAATRTLARCPGCGGKCGGTCGHSRSEPDEELQASGQRALRRAVLARRQAVSPRS